jgi:hypothetical protein
MEVKFFYVYVSYALTKVPIQAYIAELEHEKLVEIRVTAGVSRAHRIDKGNVSGLQKG